MSFYCERYDTSLLLYLPSSLIWYYESWLFFLPTYLDDENDTSWGYIDFSFSFSSSLGWYHESMPFLHTCPIGWKYTSSNPFAGSTLIPLISIILSFYYPLHWYEFLSARLFSGIIDSELLNSELYFPFAALLTFILVLSRSGLRLDAMESPFIFYSLWDSNGNIFLYVSELSINFMLVFSGFDILLLFYLLLGKCCDGLI